MNITFRSTVSYFDEKIIEEIIRSTNFFYDIEIPVAVGLVEAVVRDDENYKFIFVEIDGKTVAYACYGTIDGTIGGYDLYWIATHNDYRGQGIGKMLLEEINNRILKDDGRYIIAETSSMLKYLPTRIFYENNGYVNEGSIKDFYRISDDKIFYVKRF